MSQKSSIGWTLLAVAGALVAAVSGSAIAFNSANTAPQAVGGGLDPLAILNWGFAAIGGSAGLLGLAKTILAQWSPGLGKVVNDPLASQILNQLPAVIQIMAGGNGSSSVVLDINETIGPVTVAGKLTVSRQPAKPVPAT